MGRYGCAKKYPNGMTLTIFSTQSSLTLALLRCILTEGNVYYDGITTDSINLDTLRSNITIIPQTVRILKTCMLVFFLTVCLNPARATQRHASQESRSI